jgi:glyoxylase-like metal-dependent hydrolase (beta-lactamase superfamily II)
LEHLPGIHRIPGVRGGNAYLLQHGPLTIVDTGLPGSDSAILRFMSALGYAAQRLERILLTHRHPDHAGAAAALRERTGARVYAHAGDVEDGCVRATGGRQGARVDCLLEDGELLEGGIRVLHCGGHTAGSVSYHLEPARALFLGDMAINNIDRLSRPIVFSNEDNEAYETGLSRLAALDADAGFFGHGPPLLHGLREALIALRERPRSPLPMAVLRYAGLWLRHRTRGD